MTLAFDARSGIDSDARDGFAVERDGVAVGVHRRFRTIVEINGRHEPVEVARRGTLDIRPIQLELRPVTRTFKAEIGVRPFRQAAQMGANPEEGDDALIGVGHPKASRRLLQRTVAHDWELARRDVEHAAKRAFFEARQCEPDDRGGRLAQYQHDGRAPDVIQKFAAARRSDFDLSSRSVWFRRNGGFRFASRLSGM